MTDRTGLGVSLDRQALCQHLRSADIPTLLMTAAHLTGDLSVLRAEWRPKVAFFSALSGLCAAEEDAVRAECLARLDAFFASGKPVPAAMTYDRLSEVGRWFLGEEFDAIAPYIAEECVTAETDLRKPRWHKQKIAPDRAFHVAIVGAGISGLVMGFRLKQAGVPFTIYEKNADVGGTWWENSYPGCRCDLHSFVYSFAFKRRTWNDVFALQPEILAYLQETARECGLYEHIRFNTEVTEASWNDERPGWDILVNDRGRAERVHGDVLLFGVGQLNRPRFPDVPGVSSFDGAWFHSARWDHSVDMSGKRMGVIGTGASAVQFVPPGGRYRRVPLSRPQIRFERGLRA